MSLLGDTVSLASYRGTSVLLNLWATWCEPCRDETPYLQTVHEAYGDKGLRVVGLSQDRRGAGPAIEAFMKEFGVTYTMLTDPDMLAMQTYYAIGLPTTFLMDRKGVIRYVTIGAASPNDLDFEATIRALLQ